MASNKTILGESTAEYIEKRSKFIAVCRHCETEEEAILFIEAQKKKYWDARHNVYAYSIAGNARFSDDGEPHGTAGKPILDVINGMGLTDLAVVVTRYFGGVLLGTGGLVRAYSKSAKDALELADKAEKTVCVNLKISCPYTYHTQLVKLIEEYGGTIEDTQFATDVEISLYITKEKLCDFENALTNTFSGRISAKNLGEKLFLMKI